MKILITGTSGFIGSRLLKTACMTYGAENTIALSSQKIKGCQCIVYKSPEFEFSAREYDALTSVEVIIHAGAFIPKRAQDVNLISKCNENIYFTEKLSALPFRKLKKIIYLSTIDVYESAKIITESTHTLPTTLYGFSKLYCEKMLRLFAAQVNVGCQILRLGHVYGPGEEKYEKVIPKSIKSIIGEGRVELWGDGAEIRTFIYIDDVVTAIFNAVELNKEIDIVNVVGGLPVSARELIDCLIQISKRDVEVVHKEYNGYKRNCLFDNSKLRRHLLDTETDFMTGLQTEYYHMTGLI